MTHRLLKHVQDVARGTAPFGKLRSPHWSTVERKFKATFPSCAVCDTLKKVEVHHKKPFHLHPDLELDPRNLISLCREHHQWFGHLGDYKCSNPDVRKWIKAVHERKEE